MTKAFLEIVTIGWDLPGWSKDFYPPDLPAQWRLTYFANEFPAVLIPFRLWGSADAAATRAWAQDVHPDFRFYLELPDRAAAAAPLAQIPAMEGKLAGLVGKRSAPPGPPAPFLRWREGESARAGDAGGACSVPRPDMELRAARAWLESFAAGLKGGTGLVVLEGDTVGAEDLRRWLQLARLLGFA
jgi:hypothetical protein